MPLEGGRVARCLRCREVGVAYDYELMVVLNPEGGEERLPQKMEKLRDLIAGHGGSITDLIHWGRRRLAYPIKQHFEADYVIAQFSAAGGDGNREVEQALSIDESVLRYLLLRRDK